MRKWVTVVDGDLQRTGREDQFVDAIRNGEPRALQAVDRLLHDMRHIDDITDRELEVLALMSRGCNAKEAGRVLSLIHI